MSCEAQLPYNLATPIESETLNFKTDEEEER